MVFAGFVPSHLLGHELHLEPFLHPCAVLAREHFREAEEEIVADVDDEVVSLLIDYDGASVLLIQIQELQTDKKGIF